jgi:hypothetical protein
LEFNAGDLGSSLGRVLKIFTSLFYITLFEDRCLKFDSFCDCHCKVNVFEVGNDSPGLADTYVSLFKNSRRDTMMYPIDRHDRAWYCEAEVTCSSLENV